MLQLKLYIYIANYCATIKIISNSTILNIIIISDNYNYNTAIYTYEVMSKFMYGFIFVGLLGRCEHVLQRLSEVRAGRQRNGEDKKSKKRTVGELGNLFHHGLKSKRSKMVQKPWTHHFVCLAFCDQKNIPTTAKEKEILISAGLGEKKVHFENVDCNSQEFNEILLSQFAKLKDAGGYQLCKCKKKFSGT